MNFEKINVFVKTYVNQKINPVQ